MIEILVVIAIIAILAAIVIVAINPAKRFLDARQSQRQANVTAILNAIQQNMVDNKGIFTCTGAPLGYVAFDATVRTIKSVAAVTAGVTDLAICLKDYLAVLPFDPSNTNAKWIDATNYDTEYTVKLVSSSTGQITVSAQSEKDENGDNNVNATDQISVTR